MFLIILICEINEFEFLQGGLSIHRTLHPPLDPRMVLYRKHSTCSVVLKKGFLIIILTNLIVLILEWHGFFLSFNQVLEDISWYFA